MPMVGKEKKLDDDAHTASEVRKPAKHSGGGRRKTKRARPGAGAGGINCSPPSPAVQPSRAGVL